MNALISKSGRVATSMAEVSGRSFGQFWLSVNHLFAVLWERSWVARLYCGNVFDLRFLAGCVEAAACSQPRKSRENYRPDNSQTVVRLHFAMRGRC